MLLDKRETGPLSVNTYILKDIDSKESVLIDVGGNFEEINAETESQGYRIKYILNTHGHFDHILGEFKLKAKYPNIPVYMHKDDLNHILNIKEEMHFFDIGTDINAKIFETYPPIFIDEKSELFLGDKQIQILHTPGHSKGSLSFYVDNKLFSGDTLFYRSIGRTDFYDGDFNTLISSIKDKIFKLPDDTKVYPGHGGDTTVKNEKHFNEYLKDEYIK